MARVNLQPAVRIYVVSLGVGELDIEGITAGREW